MFGDKSCEKYGTEGFNKESVGLMGNNGSFLFVVHLIRISIVSALRMRV